MLMEIHSISTFVRVGIGIEPAVGLGSLATAGATALEKHKHFALSYAEG